MSFNSPNLRSSPILETTKAAVEPVPRPRTMPLLTYSTALSAASFLRSSWVSAEEVGEEWVTIEEGVRKLREGVRRIKGEGELGRRWRWWWRGEERGGERRDKEEAMEERW